MMKRKRGSTSLPISVWIVASVFRSSATSTRSSVRCAGSRVVCFSVAGFISPRPLKRCTVAVLPLSLPRMRSRAASSSAQCTSLPTSIL